MPRMSAVVDAFVSLIAYTYESWLSQIPKPAGDEQQTMSRRLIRNDPS